MTHPEQLHPSMNDEAGCHGKTQDEKRAIGAAVGERHGFTIEIRGCNYHPSRDACPLPPGVHLLSGCDVVHLRTLLARRSKSSRLCNALAARVALVYSSVTAPRNFTRRLCRSGIPFSSEALDDERIGMNGTMR